MKSIAEKFNVKVIGSGAETVVMAHGFGSDQEAWVNQVALLAERYRIVLFDHIGCGRLDLTDYDPALYADLNFHRDNLISIFDDLGLEKVVFIGHSVSAMLGIAAYLQRAELFEKMVFICGSPCYLNKGEYIGGFSRQDVNQMYASMSAEFFRWANGFGKAVAACAERPSLGEYFAGTLSSMRPEVAQSVAKGIFELDYRTLLPAVTLPVLIIQASKDPAVPVQVAEYLHAKIGHSTLVLLDAEGHLPHLSAPGEVNEALLEFLTPNLSAAADESR